MTQPQFFVTPGYGERMRDRSHYSQAVRVSDLVLLAGQPGWDDELNVPADPAEELRLAFDNVGRVLAAAGSSWRDVVELTSYHVALDRDAVAASAALLRERCPDHQPVWTVVGVAALARPKMHVELVVRALSPHVGSGRSEGRC